MVFFAMYLRQHCHQHQTKAVDEKSIFSKGVLPEMDLGDNYWGGGGNRQFKFRITELAVWLFLPDVANSMSSLGRPEIDFYKWRN